MNNINDELLMKNCDEIAKKDIRFNGYNWKSHRYYSTAMKAFQSDAVESIALGCEIVLPDYGVLDGIVMMHRDGRVYTMSKESYEKIY